MAMVSKHTPMSKDLWTRAARAAQMRANRLSKEEGRPVRVSVAEFIRVAIAEEAAREEMGAHAFAA